MQRIKQMFFKQKHNWSPWTYVGPTTVIGSGTVTGVLLVRICSLTQEIEFKEINHSPTPEISKEEYIHFFKKLYELDPSNTSQPIRAPITRPAQAEPLTGPRSPAQVPPQRYGQ